MNVKKAFYFDLDNTLVHRNESIAVYAENFLNDFSLGLPGVSANEIANIIYTQDNGGYLPSTSPYSSIKNAVSQSLLKLFTPTSNITAEDLKKHWVQQFPGCTVSMPGANELLRYLSGKNYHIGIISNGAHASREATARQITAFDCIDQLVSSESAGVKKPDVEIFRKIAFDAGYFPNQCWFVGDHPENDIEGARNAGIQTIWLEGFHSWPDHLAAPTHSTTTLADIKPLLERSSS